MKIKVIPNETIITITMEKTDTDEHVDVDVKDDEDNDDRKKADVIKMMVVMDCKYNNGCGSNPSCFDIQNDILISVIKTMIKKKMEIIVNRYTTDPKSISR